MAADPYHPRNVYIRQEGKQHIVYDATSGTERADMGFKTRPEAEARMRKRQAVVKGTLSRRSNKSKD